MKKLFLSSVVLVSLTAAAQQSKQKVDSAIFPIYATRSYWGDVTHIIEQAELPGKTRDAYIKVIYDQMTAMLKEEKRITDSTEAAHAPKKPK